MSLAQCLTLYMLLRIRLPACDPCAACLRRLGLCLVGLPVIASCGQKVLKQRTLEADNLGPLLPVC